MFFPLTTWPRSELTLSSIPPLPSISCHRVSSGPSKDGKNILDGSAETCWTSENLPPNSDPSTARYDLSFKFPQSIALHELHSLSLTFAGGFSPMSFDILASEQDGKTWFNVATGLFPNDTNAKQYFDISGLVTGHAREATWLRLQMQGSTDDYGRVTIYQAEIFAVSSS